MSINAIHSFATYTHPMTYRVPQPKFGEVIKVVHHKDVPISELKEKIDKVKSLGKRFYIGMITVNSRNIRVLAARDMGVIALLARTPKLVDFDSADQVLHEMNVPEAPSITQKQRAVIQDLNAKSEDFHFMVSTVNPFALVTGTDALELEKVQASWVAARLEKK